MKIFDKLLKSKEKKSYRDTPYSSVVPGVLGKFLGVSGAISHKEAMYFYENCQAVATIIDLISEAASNAPLLLNINGKPVKSHPLLTLLKFPHPDFTGRLFFNVIVTHYLLTGECYIFAGGNIRQPPRILAPISPCNVTVEQQEDGFAAAYQVSGMMYAGNYKRKPRKTRISFYSDNLTQIKQIRRFSLKENSGLRGESKLSAVALDVRQNLEGGKHNLRTLNKGGRLTLVFNIRDDMSYEKFRNAKNAIINDFSGANEGNSIAVVNANQLDVREMGNSNRDMDFANLQAMSEKAIAKRYHVPVQIISDDTSTYNNMSTAYEALYDNAVIPVIKQILDGLSDLLFPRFNLDPQNARIEVNVAQMIALAKRSALVAEKRRASYTYTDNEIRAGFGLEEIKGGESVYRPATWVKDEDENQEY